MSTKLTCLDGRREQSCTAQGGLIWAGICQGRAIYLTNRKIAVQGKIDKIILAIGSPKSLHDRSHLRFAVPTVSSFATASLQMPVTFNSHSLVLSPMVRDELRFAV